MVGAVGLCAFSWSLYSVLSGHRQFSTWIEIAIYHLLPAGMALLCFASFRFALIVRLRLFTSMVALAASVYAVELFLVVSGGSRTTTFSMVDGQPQLTPIMAALADAPDKKERAAELTRAFGGPIDLRTSREVLADLRQGGVAAIPIVTPGNHLFIRQSDGSIHSAINIDGRELMPLGGVSASVTLLCNEEVGGGLPQRSPGIQQRG